MIKENAVREKAMLFAIRIVKLYKFLCEKNEFVMSKQILRSGTSIGANIAESSRAESDNDFIHKLSISRKEGQETLYWLELLQRTDYISSEQFNSMQADCEELLKLLTSIILSTKKIS
jgi:four helix bundle protein